MIRILFIILIVFSLLPAAAQPGGVIVAKTDAPTLVTDKVGFVALNEQKFSEYNQRLSATNPDFVGIKRRPAKITAAALFGFNLVIGGKNLSWILDRDARNDYVLYADFNADGDLSNDKPLNFRNVGGKTIAEVHKTLTETIDNRRRKYAYDLLLEVQEREAPDNAGKETLLKLQDDTTRRGILNLNNRRIVFSLTGSRGIYDYEYLRLYFDLDGDGKFDSDDPYSPEVFRVDEKHINIGDRSYEYTVDRYGKSLTLRLLDKKLPARADLRVGNPAPDFSFRDRDGKQRRLSEFRGKIVLIDIWALWCTFCIREAPQLSAAYQRLKGKNFEIVSLNKNDPPEKVQKFIDEHRMNWTHTFTDEEFLKLYRVSGFPTYFLLDKEGKIISNTIRPGEEMYKMVERLAAL